MFDPIRSPGLKIVRPEVLPPRPSLFVRYYVILMIWEGRITIEKVKRRKSDLRRKRKNDIILFFIFFVRRLFGWKKKKYKKQKNKIRESEKEKKRSQHRDILELSSYYCWKIRVMTHILKTDFEWNPSCVNGSKWLKIILRWMRNWNFLYVYTINKIWFFDFDIKIIFGIDCN